MLHHTTGKLLERVEPRNSRMLRLRFNFKAKADIIVAYAPPAKSNNKDTTQEEKDKVYDDLQAMITETPKNNRLIVMGDMNARVRNADPNIQMEEK